jgi:hypothetical protein
MFPELGNGKIAAVIGDFEPGFALEEIKRIFLIRHIPEFSHGYAAYSLFFLDFPAAAAFGFRRRRCCKYFLTYRIYPLRRIGKYAYVFISPGRFPVGAFLSGVTGTLYYSSYKMHP